MKNKDNFKKAMDNIHAPEDLKNRTFQKIKDKPKNNVIYMKVLSACAVFAIIFGIGTYYNGNPNIIGGVASNKSKTSEERINMKEKYSVIKKALEAIKNAEDNNDIEKDLEISNIDKK